MKGGNYGTRTGKVINEGDYLYARLRGFNRRVGRAIEIIKEAQKIGKVAVSYSGGKDSTVLLHLVREIIPDTPTAFFDSGCELRQTYEMIKHYNVEIVKPRMSLLEMCRYGGYWGYKTPTDPDAVFNFDKELIGDPVHKFCDENNIDVEAIGLRAEESRGRKFNAKIKGELYFANNFSMWHLCPLQWWSVADIWAYIASRDLQYNGAYDIMNEIGVPRKEQRISTLLGSIAAATGRYVILKKIDPDLWNELAAEFPKIRSYT